MSVKEYKTLASSSEVGAQAYTFKRLSRKTRLIRFIYVARYRVDATAASSHRPELGSHL